MEEMPEAPRSFWNAIEAANGDVNEFRKQLLTMERSELIEMYKTYKELELDLFSDEHLERMEDNENVIAETASWVVMQGEKYYKEVYDNPEKTPSGDSLFSTFLGEIVNVFSERFNEWISLATYPAKLGNKP